MDASEVKVIVDGAIQNLVDAMRLERWKITVEYGPCGNENWAAACDREGGDYDMAIITIDPRHMHTREDVLRNLVHELLHLNLARLDVYRNVVTQGRMSHAAEQALWTHTLEQAVLGLELGVARSLWAEGGEAP